MEEKLLMKREDKWRDILSRFEDHANRKDAAQQDRPKVHSLANLTGRLVLSGLVGVNGYLGEKDNHQHDQRESQRFGPVLDHFFATSHERVPRFAFRRTRRATVSDLTEPSLGNSS